MPQCYYKQKTKEVNCNNFEKYEFSFFEKTLLSEYVRNIYCKDLTALQSIVIQHIFDRTLKWNKRFERITLDHLCNGVELNHKGVSFVRGTNLSDTRTKQVVNQLLVLGLIEKKKLSTKRVFYGLSLCSNIIKILKLIRDEIISEEDNVINLTKNELPKTKGLKTSKRYGNYSSSTSRKNKGTIVPTKTTNNIKNNKTIISDHKNDHDLTTLPDTVRDKEKVLTSEKQKKLTKTKQKTKEVKLKDFQLVWVESIKTLNANFPITSFTVKEKAQIKFLLNDISLVDGSILEFVEWVVVNWNQIKSTIRSKSNLPDIPTISILSGFRSTLLDRWSKRDSLREYLIGTDFDRIVRYYVKNGHEYEQAFALAQQETDIGKKQQELQEREKRVNLRESNLSKSENVIQQTPNFVGSTKKIKQFFQQRSEQDKNNSLSNIPNVVELPY